MTVIVGIKCEDGAVIVADGAATYGTSDYSTMTVKQPTGKKITCFGDGVIFGSSGPIGISQIVEEALVTWTTNKKSEKGKFWRDQAEFRKWIAEAVFPHVQIAVQRSAVMAQATGNRAFLTDSLAHSLFAFVSKSDIELAQVPPTCNVEFASCELPFVSVGSGQPAADPFLAFIRRVMWNGKQPNVASGVLGGLWAVRHVIDSQPGMVGDPIKIGTIRKTGTGTFELKEYTSDEVQEHLELVAKLQQSLKQTWESLFQTQPTAPIPETMPQTMPTPIVKADAQKLPDAGSPAGGFSTKS